MIKHTIKLDPETAKALDKLIDEYTPATWRGWQAVDWPALLEKQNRWLEETYSMAETHWQALNQFMTQPSAAEWKEPTQSFRGGIVEVVEDAFNPGCGWITMRDGTRYRYSVDFPADTAVSKPSDK